MQGMKSVIVTTATRTCPASSVPRLRQLEETGRAEVAAQEADDEGLPSPRAASPAARDHRLGRALEAAQQVQAVGDEEDQRAQHEERDRLLEVPLDAAPAS